MKNRLFRKNCEKMRFFIIIIILYNNEIKNTLQ